jgi:hypothetical protein
MMKYTQTTTKKTKQKQIKTNKKGALIHRFFCHSFLVSSLIYRFTRNRHYGERTGKRTGERKVAMGFSQLYYILKD